MKKLALVLLSSTCLAVCHAEETDGIQPLTSAEPVAAMAKAAAPDSLPYRWFPGRSGIPLNDDSASLAGSMYRYDFGRRGAVFGFIGPSADAGFATTPAYLRWRPDAQGTDTDPQQRWQDFRNGDARMVTVGYAWRRLQIEGSAFASGGRDDQRSGQRDLALLDSTSSRLLFQPAPDLLFQFSRGNLSNLDQLEPNEELRRTMLSATYKRNFASGSWRTTVAWGRNVRKSAGASLGYLLESTVTLRSAHAFFGRLEQVGFEEGSAGGITGSAAYKTNKFTIGYFYDLGPAGPTRYDVGALLSRQLARPEAAGRSDASSGMLFVRFWLQ